MNRSINNRIKIRAPDDWHLHLREGGMLVDTVAASAKQFKRAIVMPNLKLPVTDVDLATRYRDAILNAARSIKPDFYDDFEPLMTLYLTDNTTETEIEKAGECDFIPAVKMYPGNSTTHSQSGVRHPERLHHLYRLMARHGLLLLIHGESTRPQVDIFDREKVFIEETLSPIVERHPDLKIVLEHITTIDAVRFVRARQGRMLATITPHHLWLNRNDLFRNNGINPHHFCLPVLKREKHRLALVEAATGGEACFAAGTDSAPHLVQDKESACGCAGIFNAPCALESYAEIFDRAGALDKLENFVSARGARFYGLELNAGSVVLERSSWRMPDSISLGGGECVPFRAGETIEWRLVRSDQHAESTPPAVNENRGTKQR